MNKRLLQAIDIIVFTVLGYLGIIYYDVEPNNFDAVNFAALLYVAVRRPDINTVTLTLLVLTGRAIDSLLFYDFGSISNYVLHPSLFLFNFVAVLLIWFRPLLLSRYGPTFVRNNKNLAVTHQDMVIGFVFTLQAVFQLLAFIEHITRHFDDVGLSGYVDVAWWLEHSRIIFNFYEPIQFIFAVLGILVLYFMTFDVSKKHHRPRRD